MRRFSPKTIVLVLAVGMLCPLLAVQAAAQTARGPGLGDLAPDRLAIGGVLHSYDPAWDDGQYASTAAQEFDAITATAYMPWGPHPSQGRIDTTPLDEVVAFANANDLRVHGHTLVYPMANESLDWYQALPTGHRDVLENYVRTMASSNAGDIWVWDVINEVFADPGEQADAQGLRTELLEYDALGGRYDDVFTWAHEADPQAKLIINDYGAEELNDKSTALLAEAIAMRERGVPIDGIGFQMHLGRDPNFWSIRQNFQRFTEAGFDLYITELDVSIVQQSATTPKPTAADRSLQRAIYEEVTRIALEQPAVKSLLMWDFADERSWLHPTRQPLGPIAAGTYTFPAPFREPSVGEPLIRKTAYYGMVEALKDASDRPVFQRGERRLQAVGGPNAVYLGRSGIGPASDRPGESVWLGQLTSDREDWLSLRWNVEPAANGWFRIRSAWNGADGYLTRVGQPNDDGGYDPTNAVSLQALNESWPSQLWRIERVARFRYRLVNLWEPHTGVLTRDSGELTLEQTGRPWTTQRWRIRQLN